MKSPKIAAAALLATGGLLLSACATQPTLEESWPEVRQKVVDAQSLHLKMDGTAKEDASGSASASSSSDIQSGTIDLAGATDDSHLKGTVAAKMGDGEVNMDILRLGQDVYMRINKAEGGQAPEGMDAFQQIVGDRWMLMPADQASDMGELSLGTVMDDLEEDMPAADAFNGKDVKAEEVDLDGRKVLKYALPEEHKDFGRTMYVDKETKELYRLEDVNSVESEADATATFTEWNAVQAPERPAENEVFDMQKLSEGLAG